MTHDGGESLEARLGARIATCRRRLGLSQAELAEATGLSLAEIIRYEAGKGFIGASTLWCLSQALEVPVGVLYDGEGQAI